MYESIVLSLYLLTFATSGVSAMSSAFPAALQPSRVTLLGYGALLSESSSRLTFPNLTNYRHVRVLGLQRVFAHPHLFLVKQGLVDPSKTLYLASLSVEPAGPESSLVVAAFDVTLDDKQRQQFVLREPEYDISTTAFYKLAESEIATTTTPPPAAGQGVICLASRRDADLTRMEIPFSLKEHPNGVWHWPKDSGLLPADIYLRHCLLAVQKAGGPAYQSFLNDTYLADRVTTLADYLEQHGEQVMASRPPPHLATRFGG